jgi:hypothetical protein
VTKPLPTGPDGKATITALVPRNPRGFNEKTRIGLVAGAVGVAATAVAIAGPGTSTGPSSSHSPYLVPTAAGVSIKSILTTGDSVNTKPDGTPYRLVGIPDGLGAFENDDHKTFTLLANHTS